MNEGTLEECIDRLDDHIDTLARFPAPVIALALRVHLTALLRALLESHALNAAQVHAYIDELRREVFG